MIFVCCFCFFKQKTAYERRISDWSSDVCSSDLRVFWIEDRKWPVHSENVDILIDDLRCGCVESSAVDECAAAVESFGPGKHFLRRSPREGAKKNLLGWDARSEEHTSELQSLMRISYAVFCLKKKSNTKLNTIRVTT